MSNSWVPDPEERSFAEMVREGARELREQRGPCPSSDELAAFFSGRLEPEGAARVRNHVDACGLCDAALGRLEMPGKRPTGPGWTSLPGLFRSPIVAYALALILAYPAYRGVTSSGHSPDPARLPISAPRYVLDSVRGVQSTPTVKLLAGRDVFILSFLVPVRSDFHYSVEIVNSASTSIGPASELVAEDAMGHCSLICPRQMFHTGMYTLTVKERAPRGALTDRHFAFQFTVEE